MEKDPYYLMAGKQFLINLWAGSSMGVGMLPIGAGSVFNFEFVKVGLSLRNDIARVPVHF